MAGSITFSGNGPYDLPVAQLVSAESQGEAVTLSFRVLTTPNRAEVVRIAVLNNQALDLAGAIALAVANPKR